MLRQSINIYNAFMNSHFSFHFSPISCLNLYKTSLQRWRYFFRGNGLLLCLTYIVHIALIKHGRTVPYFQPMTCWYFKILGEVSVNMFCSIARVLKSWVKLQKNSSAKTWWRTNTSLNYWGNRISVIFSEIVLVFGNHTYATEVTFYFKEHILGVN